MLALLSAETRETLERWQFDINLEPPESDEPLTEDKENQSGDVSMGDVADGSVDKGKAREGARRKAAPPKAPKTEKEIQAEIQGIIRQITASVTFLPVLTEKCASLTLASHRGR